MMVPLKDASGHVYKYCITPNSQNTNDHVNIYFQDGHAFSSTLHVIRGRYVGIMQSISLTRHLYLSGTSEVCSQGCIEVNGPLMNNFMSWTITFEWFVVGYGCNNPHQKKMSSKEIRQRAPNMATISCSIPSQHNGFAIICFKLPYVYGTPFKKKLITMFSFR